ncbi:MAG: HEAT repeat domain-containing protein [Gemmataceae bacterium]|nr:HEAT repeat domain-containing protein [Gemmataceae bacterium]
MRRPLSLLALGLVLTQVPGTRPAAAAPPPAPAAFAQPQSAAKPEPFPVTMVDQGKYDPALKGYFLPDGFRLEIVLAEPDVVNPVGMTFAPDGSLFVLEWRQDPVAGDRWVPVAETFRYRDGTTRAVTTMKKFTVDPVKHFAPNPATGRFSPPKTIIAEELPSSILWHDGWLYVTGRGTVRRWGQASDGGVGTVDPRKLPSTTQAWNVREVIAQGFCGFHHHQVSGLSIGNDGLLYLTSGDDDNYAEGSDGSRATVLRTGAVFRCKPDGSNLETYSLGYRNPYRDLAHDDRFNWFHADNDNEDGSKFMGCRIMHVAEGADFGWRLKYGSRCCRPDDARVSVAGEVPGKLPPMVKTGRGSPAGLLIPHDTRIPEPYRGLLYYPDVYRKVVRAYKTAPAGSSFDITHEFEFFKSSDPLFRPCQMVQGPDGAIYVCDWRTDSGGAGKLSGDGVHGRVYRIRWVGTAQTPELPLRGLDSWAKILKLDDDKLVDVLSAPDLTDRVEARKELVRRGAKGRDAVLRRFVSGKIDGLGRLPALGVLQAGWSAEVEDLFRLLLADESADVRRLVVEALGAKAKPGDTRAADGLRAALADPDPAVRRTAALAVGRLHPPGAADALVNALKASAEADPFLKDAFVRGLEAMGKPGVDALVAWAGADPTAFARAADAFVSLRTRPAADALPQLLASPHATPAQREALVASYNNYQLDPPVSLDPLADFLMNRPAEPASVVAAGIEAFAAADAGLQSPKATSLVLTMLGRPDPAVRLAAIRAVEATRLSAAATRLVALLAEPNRPADERTAVVKALRVLGRTEAAGPVAALLAGADPLALKVEALRTLAALDPPAGRKAAEAALDQSDPVFLAEAVSVLGATKAGAKLVGTRYAAEKLPRDLFPAVADALRRFADDPAVADLQSQVSRGGLKLALEPGRAAKVRQDVSAKGDPKRGRELYLNTKLLACATCHKMEGVGGAIGPDLTRVWDTHPVEKLVESIADPHKEIKEGFQAYRLVTADGQVLGGLKVSETASEVVVRDATGRDTRVAKEDVESLVPSKLSLMPDDTVARLSYDQFLDLLAFLGSRPDQESLRGFVAAAGVSRSYPPELTGEKPEADPKTGQWQPLAADPAGVLDLKPAFPSDGPAGVYVRAFVYSPTAQTAIATLRADDPVRVWVNGTAAFTRPTAAPSGEGSSTPPETFPVRLKPGFNPVLVKVAAGGGPAHRLTLRFAGPEVRAAAVPDGGVGK